MRNIEVGLNNPLLDYFEKHGKDVMGATYTIRSEAIQKYAFAIPNTEAIERIAQHGPVVEMFAGSGYWASFLKQAGADIIAYDNFTWQREEKLEDPFYWQEHMHFDVQIRREPL